MQVTTLIHNATADPIRNITCNYSAWFAISSKATL